MEKRKMSHFEGVRKVSLVILAIALFLVSSAYSDVKFDTPVVGQYSSSVLEIGATFTMDIVFVPAETTKITSIQLDFNYNSGVLENASVIDKVSGLSGSQIDYSKPGEIRYQRWVGVGDTGFQVTKDQPVTIYQVKFHVKQSNDLIKLYGEKELIYWREPHNSYVYLKVKDSDLTVNRINSSYRITGSHAPDFKGLLDQKIYDGDSWSQDTSIGNTLALNWVNNVNGASDLFDEARTHYTDGKLRYNIYRDTSNDPAVIQNTKKSGPILTNTGNDYTYKDTDNLSDCTTYYYLVRAQDDCSGNNPGHIEEKNTNVLSGKPHDYIPPEFQNGKVELTAGDGNILVNWSDANNPHNDLRGYLVVRKDGKVEPSGKPVSAYDNLSDSDGTNYETEVGKVFGDGKIVYCTGPASQFTDKDVINGQSYTYKVWAYDKATNFDDVNNPQREQGRNYSKTPISSSGAPGVAPPSVGHVKALSDPSTGDITLQWTHPDYPKQPTGYGGALVLYCTDPGVEFANWDNMQAALKDNVQPPYFFGVDVPLEAPDKTESMTILKGLGTLDTYYFKVFAYNQVPDPNNRKYADGVKVAAVPLKGQSQPFTLNLKTNVSGINLFSMPFSSPWYAFKNNVALFGGVEIKTAYDLVKSINEAAGNNLVVSTFGYWDADKQVLVKVLLPGNNPGVPENNQGKALSEINLLQGVGYQVFVTQPVDLVIKNIAQ